MMTRGSGKKASTGIQVTQGDSGPSGAQASDSGPSGAQASDQTQQINSGEMSAGVDIAAMLLRIESKIDTNILNVQELKSQISSIQHSLSVTSETANEALSKANAVDRKLDSVDSSMADLKKEMAKLRMENKQVKDQLVRSEAYSRRDNLLLNGIEENDSEDLLQIVYATLENNLGFVDAKSKIKIVRCHRLGPKKTDRHAKPRPVIFKLHYYPDRESIWKQRSLLKGTNISLSEDFPQEILTKRQVLDAIRRKANSQQKKAFLTVYRLILEDKTYTVDTLHSLPLSLQPKEVFTRRSDTYTAFYNRHSPLSNFYPCNFKDSDGIHYTSNEQFFQYKKAIHCGNQETAQAILCNDDPAVCKRLGAKVNIPDYKLWDDESKTIMFEGCLAKFKQNKDLHDFLLSTKETILLEASPYDKKWGIGMSLNDKDLFKPDCWRGANNLGKTLQKVRDELIK